MSLFRTLAPETIRRIADANPIKEIVGADVALKKAGALLVGLCPFHQEKTPSLTVTPARNRWKCFGCGAGGDVFAYLMARAGIGFLESARQLAQRGGIYLEGAEGHETQTVTFLPRSVSSEARDEPARSLWLPTDLRPIPDADLRTVASQRGLSCAGLELARARGLLWHGSRKGRRAWIVTDGQRVNAQARRMDGGLWRHIGNKKAWTLPGSQAGWPIGTTEANAFPCVALVEGGPDFAAAHHFIVAEDRQEDTAAVGMLGACNAIPESALFILANKRVRIFPHLDPAGQEAARRWTRQLERVGCEVDAFSFDGLRCSSGPPVKDLNDFARIDADCFEAERADLERILPR